MPITLGQLTANRKALTIPCEGGELRIEYYPRRLTAQMLIEYAETDKIKDMPPERVMQTMASPTDMLVVLLATWDLAESIDEDGQAGLTLPINRETLIALGVLNEWQILGAIIGDCGNQG